MYRDGSNQALSRNSFDASSSRLPSSIGSDNGVMTLVGKTVEDCKAQLFQKYGTSYDIIGKRQILKSGFFGFGQKELTEVKYVLGQKLSSAESFQKNRDELLAKTTASVTQTVQIASIDKKIEDLQKTFSSKIDQMLAATNAQEKHVSIQQIEDLLQENEFTFSYINEITTRLRSELTIDELDDFDFVQKTVIDWIGKNIQIAPNVPHKFPHVIIIVGPTGVGKTTTIAKLAGTMILEAKAEEKAKPSIRMITIDHTRVGAEEQLRRYGNLMNVDVDKAESAADVKKIFDDYKDSLDVLFIDTPGYSPNDYENIAKMRKMLEVQGIHPDVYLAVAASAKARDLDSIIQNYEVFNFGSVIITKWDETTRIGNVLSVLHKKNKPISFITDGQQVPRKIERATVVKFLINLHEFSVDRAHIDELFPEDK